MSTHNVRPGRCAALAAILATIGEEADPIFAAQSC